jgi:hypothetical protein
MLANAFYLQEISQTKKNKDDAPKINNQVFPEHKLNISKKQLQFETQIPPNLFTKTYTMEKLSKTFISLRKRDIQFQE